VGLIDSRSFDRTIVTGERRQNARHRRNRGSCRATERARISLKFSPLPVEAVKSHGSKNASTHRYCCGCNCGGGCGGTVIVIDLSISSSFSN
jgi:hypothetical protein